MSPKCCSQCKDSLEACDVSSADGFITCTCNAAIHYTCLQAAEETSFSWGNNNKPSKLSIQLMNSPCFMFTCASCRDSTTSPSAMPRHSPDPLDVKSMEDLIIRVESSLVDLKNQSINITSLLTSSNHISHASSISNTSYISNPPHINATKTYASLFTNSSSSTSSRNKSAHIPVPLTPSLVIENLDTSQRNLPFLKSILSKLDLDPNTITTISFKSNRAFLTLSSPFIYDAIISSRNKLKDSNFSKLFFRPQLSDTAFMNGRVLFHACKSGIVTGHKCIFNYRTSRYELRPCNDSKIDWKCEPLSPSSDELALWEKSFIEYKEIIKSKSKSTSSK